MKLNTFIQYSSLTFLTCFTYSVLATEATPTPASTSTPPAATSDAVIATVNGTSITQKQLDTYLNLRKQNKENPMPEDMVINGLISRELLVQDALKQKLEQQADFQTKIEDFRLQLLLETAIDQYMKQHPTSEEDLQKRYDDLISGMEKPKDFKAKHILVDSEEVAKKVIAELDAGKAFADLATQYSIDKESASKGGSLDWVNPQEVSGAFAQALRTVKAGSYTKQPVKTEFGWHVIFVEETKEKAPPAFEQVRSQVATMVQNEKMQSYLTDLRKDAKIEMLRKSATPTPEIATEKTESK